MNENQNAEIPSKIHSKWSRFSEYVHCMCVVTFDLEIGQAMEKIYPEHVSLSEQEKMNICYLAFPDSNSGCMGDTQFHVRLRTAPNSQQYQENGSYPLTKVHRQFNAQCIPVQKADVSHYWGFVYFRQKKDTSLPRGYFQKSFIILTRLPFFNLFNEVLSLIAPRYFSDGFVVMQSACEQICTWPRLKAGESLNLHLLGTLYQTVLPRANSKGHGSTSSSNNCNKNTVISNTHPTSNISSKSSCDDSLRVSREDTNLNEGECDNWQHQQIVGPTLPPQVLVSVHEIDIFRSLSCVLSDIYTLWELVLTAEPIVVIGTSPSDCSHMVQSLLAMIAPLSYCAESRPYFTIHDSEFKEFTQDTKGPPPAIILGVTNPFFVKLLKHWPHMIRLADNQSTNQSSNSYSAGSSASSRILILSSTTSNNTTPDLSTAAQQKKRDNAPGVYTKYKPFLKKDKALIKKIVLGIKTKRPEQVQSALLRRNLLELTQSFMIPLERYMASLMPLQRDISPFKSAPSPSQFKQDDFLATLELSGPHLTSPLKGNWKGLYKRFFKSPNFKGWYEARHKELQQTLQALQLQALSDADLNQWAQGKQEVEIVDMIIKLKQKLTLCSDGTHQPTAGSSDPEPTANGSMSEDDNYTESNLIIDENNIILQTSTRKQLLRQLDNMKQSLPDDLKVILADK